MPLGGWGCSGRPGHRGGTTCVQVDRNTQFPLTPSGCSIPGSLPTASSWVEHFCPVNLLWCGLHSAHLLHPREVMCFLGDALLTHLNWLCISFLSEGFAPIRTNLTSDFFQFAFIWGAQGFLFDSKLMALIPSQMSLVLSHCVIQEWPRPQLLLEMEGSCQNTEHWTPTCWPEQSDPPSNVKERPLWARHRNSNRSRAQTHAFSRSYLRCLG